MAAELQIEDQESVTNVDIGDNNFESLSDHADSGLPRLFSADSMPLLLPGSLEYDIISTCFLSGMGPLTSDTKVVTVRKNSTEEVTTKAKFLVFRVFTEAMVRKNNGDANVKYGWYSGSKEEINSIISYGFSSREIEKFENDTRSHGIGIHLVPHKNSLAGAITAEPDDEGIRYLLLCRLILGNPEPVIYGSKQSYPSSTQFDSGVDNLQNPRKYVIWSSTMNSYILPSYVVSFRSPRLQGPRIGGGSTRARSPWVSFSALMSILSNSLDRPRMNMILRTFNEFRKRKLRKDQLVRLLREVVGDNLLLDIIKNQRNREQPPFRTSRGNR